MVRFLTAALAGLSVFALSARADDKKADEGPITAKLVGKTTTFKLDGNADDIKKQLEAAKKSGAYPASPKVDFTLEVTNTSDKEIQIWTAGDAVVVGLELKGPGAVSVSPQKAFTDDFRVATATKLAPGKSVTIPVKSLDYGFRGASSQAYWTEAGDYTLAATFKTGISPAPKGAKDVQEGFGVITVTTEPIKIKVEAK